MTNTQTATTNIQIQKHIGLLIKLITYWVRKFSVEIVLLLTWNAACGDNSCAVCSGTGTSVYVSKSLRWFCALAGKLCRLTFNWCLMILDLFESS